MRPNCRLQPTAAVTLAEQPRPHAAEPER